MPLDKHVGVSNLQPEQGQAYTGQLGDRNLSDHERPSGAALYLIETRSGSLLNRWPAVLSESFAFSWLKALLEARFPTSTYDVRIRLGPGQSSHQDIRDRGDGRYSVWHGNVYFSLPSGVSFARVRGLDLIVPRFFNLNREDIAKGIDSALTWVSVGAAICLAVHALTLVFGGAFWCSRIVQNAVPGVAVTLVLCGIILVSGEFYLRATGKFPKQQRIWPSQFVENVGFIFQPGTTVKYTNGLEYWTEDRVNSLGFIDHEPVLPKPPDTFRVLLVGDSFVEAVQIPLAHKLQTLLANSLKARFPGRKLDVVAMGYSGTGQANQLTFYERSRADLRPDVVILVFVGNDFPNNSPLLESVRMGWHPEHSPRLFMKKTSDGRCTRLPIASDWQKHLVPGGTNAERLKQIRAMSSSYDLALGDWEPAKGDIDSIFYQVGELPPAFEESIELTKCALQEWKSLADQDGFSLIVVAAENVTVTIDLNERPETRGQIIRLRNLLKELNIPLLDLYPEFIKRGDLAVGRWKFDPHWSQTGHQWASDSIVNYLADTGLLTQRGSQAVVPLSR